MAPALIGRDKLSVAAMLIKPMPNVPATVQELPMLKPISAQTKQAVT